MTIKEYYKHGIRGFTSPAYTGGTAHTVKDFYDGFVAQRLPNPETVKKWHDLLVAYLNEEDAVYFIRKYESGRDGEDEWANRRGAVTRFADGFEYVFASNLLAHEIYFMAYNGFVPSLDDFRDMVKSRALRISSGTKVEKEIRLYPSANKKLKCYLAHIAGVNGAYRRADGTARALASTKKGCSEGKRIYPRGGKEDWTCQSDKIRKLNYSLTSEEKEIVKAHCLRFLDPINYFVAPQTKHCIHHISGFVKNIGEYESVVAYVAKQYKACFGKRYEEFLEIARVVGVFSAAEIGEGGETVIDLEYDVRSNSYGGGAKAATSAFEAYLCSLGKSLSTAKSYGSVIRRIESEDAVNLDLSNVDEHIRSYSKGGAKYDPTEHGTIRNALIRYRDYLLSEEDA